MLIHCQVFLMNISKDEQRVLHALAQGGVVRHFRNDKGRITKVECVTKEGYILANCTIAVFNKLRRKRLIESKASLPYQISDTGRRSVRAQVDNR
jgi:uncharacterized protein